MRVGFIGLGTMGCPAAKNILKKGHTLVVHDIDKNKAAPLLEQGAQWGENPRACAESADYAFVLAHAG